MATKTKLHDEEKAFYRGVLIGLQHIRRRDCSVTYRALMRDVGGENVVRAAVEEAALEWSGLLYYKWADRLGRYTPHRAA